MKDFIMFVLLAVLSVIMLLLLIPLWGAMISVGILSTMSLLLNHTLAKIRKPLSKIHDAHGNYLEKIVLETKRLDKKC